LRHKNLLQRSSSTSSRPSTNDPRRSTSFLRPLATSAPSPASFDGCSSLSLKTSGESSWCAHPTEGRAAVELGPEPLKHRRASFAIWLPSQTAPTPTPTSDFRFGL
jgi:hypothetical protein